MKPNKHSIINRILKEEFKTSCEQAGVDYHAEMKFLYHNEKFIQLLHKLRAKYDKADYDKQTEDGDISD